jgi:hypothetical protein
VDSIITDRLILFGLRLRATSDESLSSPQLVFNDWIYIRPSCAMLMLSIYGVLCRCTLLSQV